MGHKFDKHGRTNWNEEQLRALNSEICPRCGAKVQNKTEHNALFHPVYREDSKEKKETKLVPAADQSKLFSDQTLDEGAEKGA